MGLMLHDWITCKDTKNQIELLKKQSKNEGYTVGLNNQNYVEEFGHMLAHATGVRKGIAKNWDKEQLETVLALASMYIRCPKRHKN